MGEAHLLGDNGEVEKDGAGVSKTFEFGGIMKAEWGCKVTFEKSKKGVSKKVKCGAKFDAGSGKKEMAEGTSVWTTSTKRQEVSEHFRKGLSSYFYKQFLKERIIVYLRSMRAS